MVEYYVANGRLVARAYSEGIGTYWVDIATDRPIPPPANIQPYQQPKELSMGGMSQPSTPPPTNFEGVVAQTVYDPVGQRDVEVFVSKATGSTELAGTNVPRVPMIPKGQETVQQTGSTPISPEPLYTPREEAQYTQKEPQYTPKTQPIQERQYTPIEPARPDPKYVTPTQAPAQQPVSPSSIKTEAEQELAGMVTTRNIGFSPKLRTTKKAVIVSVDPQQKGWGAEYAERMRARGYTVIDLGEGQYSISRTRQIETLPEPVQQRPVGQEATQSMVEQEAQAYRRLQQQYAGTELYPQTTLPTGGVQETFVSRGGTSMNVVARNVWVPEERRFVEQYFRRDTGERIERVPVPRPSKGLFYYGPIGVYGPKVEGITGTPPLITGKAVGRPTAEVQVASRVTELDTTAREEEPQLTQEEYERIQRAFPEFPTAVVTGKQKFVGKNIKVPVTGLAFESPEQMRSYVVPLSKLTKEQREVYEKYIFPQVKEQLTVSTSDLQKRSLFEREKQIRVSQLSREPYTKIVPSGVVPGGAISVVQRGKIPKEKTLFERIRQPKTEREQFYHELGKIPTQPSGVTLSGVRAKDLIIETPPEQYFQKASYKTFKLAAEAGLIQKDFAPETQERYTRRIITSRPGGFITGIEQVREPSKIPKTEKLATITYGTFPVIGLARSFAGPKEERDILGAISSKRLYPAAQTLAGFGDYGIDVVEAGFEIGTPIPSTVRAVQDIASGKMKPLELQEPVSPRYTQVGWALAHPRKTIALGLTTSFAVLPGVSKIAPGVGKALTATTIGAGTLAYGYGTTQKVLRRQRLAGEREDIVKAFQEYWYPQEIATEAAGVVAISGLAGKAKSVIRREPVPEIAKTRRPFTEKGKELPTYSTVDVLSIERTPSGRLQITTRAQAQKFYTSEYLFKPPKGADQSIFTSEITKTLVDIPTERAITMTYRGTPLRGGLITKAGGRQLGIFRSIGTVKAKIPTAKFIQTGEQIGGQVPSFTITTTDIAGKKALYLTRGGTIEKITGLSDTVRGEPAITSIYETKTKSLQITPKKIGEPYTGKVITRVTIPKRLLRGEAPRTPQTSTTGISIQPRKVTKGQLTLIERQSLEKAIQRLTAEQARRAATLTSIKAQPKTFIGAVPTTQQPTRTARSLSITKPVSKQITQTKPTPTTAVGIVKPKTKTQFDVTKMRSETRQLAAEKAVSDIRSRTKQLVEPKQTVRLEEKLKPAADITQDAMVSGEQILKPKAIQKTATKAETKWWYSIGEKTKTVPTTTEKLIPAYAPTYRPAVTTKLIEKGSYFVKTPKEPKLPPAIRPWQPPPPPPSGFLFPQIPKPLGAKGLPRIGFGRPAAGPGAERTIYPSLFQIEKSKFLYGKATFPSLTKRKELSKYYYGGDLPTVEQLDALKKKRKRRR